MSVSRGIAAFVVASLAAAPAFAGSAEPVGSVTAASAGTFVSRDGKLLPVKAGSALYTGDKLITRNGARAKAALSGCNVSLSPVSVVRVGDNKACATPKSLAVAAAQDDGAPGAAEGGDAGKYVVGALGIGAVGLGIYQATNNPPSP